MDDDDESWVRRMEKRSQDRRDWLGQQAFRSVSNLIQIPKELRTRAQQEMIDSWLEREKKQRRRGLVVINGGRSDIAPPSHDRWAEGKLELIEGGLM